VKCGSRSVYSLLNVVQFRFKIAKFYFWMFRLSSKNIENESQSEIISTCQIDRFSKQTLGSRLNHARPNAPAT
jgi:hypothetical protein